MRRSHITAHREGAYHQPHVDEVAAVGVVAGVVAAGVADADADAVALAALVGGDGGDEAAGAVSETRAACASPSKNKIRNRFAQRKNRTKPTRK